MLAVGVAAQAAGTVFVSTPAFLIPLLHTERGLSLAEAGTLAAAPTFGLVLTLIAWGALVDRIGERWVIAGGLVLVALAAAAATVAEGYAWLGFFLLLGGAASGSTSAASGRVVVGWFPKDRRGFAMGIRQMSQPLGVTIAALAVPPLAQQSIATAIVLSLALTAVLAVASALVIVNPPRPSRADAAATTNPYRASSYLWRIHGVSALLVVPQFTLSTFGLVWMTVGLGIAAPVAGIIVGVSQFIGAIGRIGAGQLSDRVGSRVRPLRWVAVAGIVAMGLLAITSLDAPVLACVIYVIATTISVADNGLAFTSVAEVAGPFWSGRALGAQNTGQFIAASGVGPAIGALIGVAGYPVAFAVSALAAAIAVPFVPSRAAELSAEH